MTDWDKRALELFPEALSHPHGWIPPIIARDKALQLGQEMADERAEEIAKLCEARAVYRPLEDSAQSAALRTAASCAAGARSTIKQKKTREQVLEEALRNARDAIKHGNWPDSTAMSDALRYKP